MYSLICTQFFYLLQCMMNIRGDVSEELVDTVKSVDSEINDMRPEEQAEKLTLEHQQKINYEDLL